MLYAKINGHRSVEVDPDATPPRIDGADIALDVARLSENRFHIIKDGKSFQAEVMEIDRQTKTVTVRINGSVHVVQLKEKLDLLLEKLGMNNSGNARLNNLRAPMPGLIIDLRVSEGQAIRAGDPLLILEAMKMENVIKATGDGVVKRVNVKKGDSVEKGHVLIEF